MRSAEAMQRRRVYGRQYDAEHPRDHHSFRSREQLAIDAMCAWCEPDGKCHMHDCPLRGVSPLSLAAERQGMA